MNQSNNKAAGDWFSPVESARTSDRVAEAIRETIVDGRFLPGEILPPERVLAKKFQVTRNTVREALKKLELSRLVSIRQGSGARVLDYLANAGFEFISTMFGSRRTGQKELIADLGQARTVVGQAIYHHAIDHFDMRADKDVNAAVDDLAAEAAKSRPDVRKLQELDFEVQHRLLRGGKNRTFILLHNSIRHIYSRMANLFEPLVENPGLLVERYRRMLAELKSGNRTGARRIISEIFSEQEKAMARKK
ncbi:MAG TPA: GntR family transcriptional regulator [Myxococcota bacterium]|nr:GntR family transcriptional regulator [Myxococcota bacterium]